MDLLRSDQVKHYRVLVCINVQAENDFGAEDRVLALFKLSPAMGRPDQDWCVERIEEEPDPEDDGEEFLKKMEQAADEHAAGLPFGGSR